IQLNENDPVVPANKFNSDLDDEGPYPGATNNFDYDKTGNLIRDNAAGITMVKWNGRNKVSRIDSSKGVFEFIYDGNGDRIAKVEEPSTDPKTWETDYFIRDEAGHLLATYHQAAQGTAPSPPAVNTEDLY